MPIAYLGLSVDLLRSEAVHAKLSARLEQTASLGKGDLQEMAEEHVGAQDPVSTAIQLARERLGSTLAVAGAEGLAQGEDVQRAVASAFALFAGPGIRSTDTVLAEYTAEIVAVGALSRAAAGEEPMTQEEVKGVKDFLRIIFNGLFDK